MLYGYIEFHLKIYLMFSQGHNSETWPARERRYLRLYTLESEVKKNNIYLMGFHKSHAETAQSFRNIIGYNIYLENLLLYISALKGASIPIAYLLASLSTIQILKCILKAGNKLVSAALTQTRGS